MIFERANRLAAAVLNRLAREDGQPWLEYVGLAVIVGIGVSLLIPDVRNALNNQINGLVNAIGNIQPNQ